MATAQEKAGQPEQLGQVHFSVSCTAAAQQEFDRAMALLHSFEFRKAEKAFKRVTEIEPGCAMGHWGIAMRWFSNPLGGPPSRKALQDGWAAVEQAKAIGAHTARERDYIATLETFYKDADTRDHRTRALAYEQAMQQLSLQYPEDREAAILYALALNMTALPTDKTYANQLKAAEILDHVFAELPHHPGVAHYLIHTYDYPALASRGLPAARRYASIAPSSPHALHMPAHIFTRLGLWQESIDANRASATAGKEYAAQAHPGVASNYQPHAMDYMMYAYLQGARDKAAGAVLEELSEIRKVDVEGRGSAYAFAAIPARYALERRRWADAMALTVQPTDFPWTRFPEAEAVTYFARALGAARSGDAAAARQDIDRLKALHHALIEAKRDYWVEQVEIQHHVAAAWVARIEGKNDEALQLMRSAADREDATEKHIVTPGPLFPARELLGELLLELNEPAQALQEFEASIHKEPNRFNGAYGAARAAELVGNREKAKAYYAKLLALCEQADTERPALQQAKAFLAK
jgi:tetratricopeptide (TPR) repeat protein